MKYRAVMYKNEGLAVRLLMDISEYCDSADVAIMLAEDMKADHPAPEYWTAVVSEKTSPHSFI